MDIKRIVKNLLLKITPNFIKSDILRAVNIFYSQEGEDILLNRLLENKYNGFYIDVGAHHPTRFSNTYFFYKCGWRGINIDATPGSMETFKKLRPRDINIESAISLKKQKLKFHIFNEPALNTFSENEAIKKDGLGNFKIIKTIEIETQPLKDILNKHVSPDQVIDFMSIDVEGLDFEVLKSNDWLKYRPNFILIELLSVDLEKISKNEIGMYLKELGYVIVAKTYNTFFFKNTL